MAFRTLKTTLMSLALVSASFFCAEQPVAAADSKKPHIVVIWGDDIGQSNISA